MQLRAGGREYAYLPVQAPLDAGTATVTFPGVTGSFTGEWQTTGPEGQAPPTGYTRWLRLLVAGPDATANPAGTAVLTAGCRHTPRVTLPDTPEIVIRDAEGTISVE